MNPSTRRVVAITGAAGLLGRALCERFAAAGWSVRALTRDADPARLPPGVSAFRANLPDDLDPGAFAGCHAVIHAAYSMRSRSRAEDERVNVQGTRQVLRLARAANVPRFVFVSSVSAHPAAQGFYGQSKLALERELDLSRDLIIRPGLILSTRAGLFVRMLRTVRSTGLAPMFGGGRQVIQTIHIDDLSAAFLRAVEGDVTGLLTLCEPGGLEMRALFRLLGELLHRRVTIVPLPFGPALIMLRIAEGLGLRLPVSSDNLLGLRSMVHVESQPSLDRLSMTVRDVRASLQALLANA